jgi:hypothetical protein
MDRTQKLSRANLPLKTIPLICSWCNKIYRIEQWKFEENQRTGVSHGICPECLSKMDGQLVEEELPADEGEEFVDDPEAGFPDELDASEDASFEDDGRTR